MHTSARFAPLVGLLALLAGCAESDTTVGPDPVPTGPPTIRQFTVAQTDVVHGEWTQLNWKIEGARNASITPEIGLLSTLATGAQSIRPTRDITYTLTASNDHGTTAATISIAVTYRSGIYVNRAGGDDANSGASPQDPIATLTEAFARTAGGGALFVAAGTYNDNLVIDGPRRLIYGGLNPDTFLQDDDYETIIRPLSGNPLEIRGPSSQVNVLDHITLDAQHGGTHALSVESAPVRIQDCQLNGTKCGSGTAVRLSGDAEVTLLRSGVRGGENDVTRHDDAIGIRIQDGASLLARDCFISGGYALRTSSGVDMDSYGSVALGLSTISAGLFGGAGDFATPIRIRSGHPAIGGNILFTRGSGPRPAVIEEAADADPSWFHANLIVGVSIPIYDNHSSDGADPVDEAGVNNYQLVTGNVGTVGENLFRILAPSQMLANVDHFDYHLVNPLTTGGANPAINSMPRVFDGSLYGILPTEQPRDIDGENRPNSYRELDRGADEY
ncbi:hypothetical protein K8I85_17725 [bacterium]|nr:hypothetical protein [bacterium]